MLIEVKNIYKEIHGNTVLNNINLVMQGGNIYGLRGENGSGKTMFLRCLAGLLIPSCGEIIIDKEILGKDIDFPRSIGILLENPAFLNGYSGYQNLEMLAKLHKKVGADDIKMMLRRVGLNPDDKRKYKKYSLGMKQRLGIANALLECPEIILLDEPFNALDPGGVDIVKELIFDMKKLGALIVIACHDSKELDLIADKIYTVNNGYIIYEG